MRIFSYRNKMRLRRVGLGMLIAALALAVACTAYVIYLGRFMVYTADGAHLALPGAEERADTSPAQTPSGEYIVGEKAERPASAAVPVVSTGDELPTELAGGYFVTTADLRSLDTTKAALEQALEQWDAAEGAMVVLLDLKSEFGNFYYPSDVTDTPGASVDMDAVDSLMKMLDEKGVYLIARLPAFRDSAYALSHTDRALALASGALWADSDGCYWLDPGSDIVCDRLLALCTELAAHGVDEVAFSDFTFPGSENIVYEGDRALAVASSAERLAGSSPIPVSFSFAGDEATVAAAPYGHRVLLYADGGSDIASALSFALGEDAADGASVAFLSASRDTRFDAYLQLRPLGED